LQDKYVSSHKAAPRTEGTPARPGRREGQERAQRKTVVKGKEKKIEELRN